MTQTQLARIQRMESLLDESTAAMKQLENALEQYASIQPKLTQLANYYQSEVWMQDYESDEKGLLPSDLKRGVLSQDAVDDLLLQQRQLQPVLNAWNQEESDCV